MKDNRDVPALKLLKMMKQPGILSSFSLPKRQAYLLHNGPATKGLERDTNPPPPIRRMGGGWAVNQPPPERVSAAPMGVSPIWSSGERSPTLRGVGGLE